ncbi:MAG: hypothetical protein QOF93_1451, partial [Verrucomicrobiota bacterium]
MSSFDKESETMSQYQEQTAHPTPQGSKAEGETKESEEALSRTRQALLPLG